MYNTCSQGKNEWGVCATLRVRVARAERRRANGRCRQVQVAAGGSRQDRTENQQARAVCAAKGCAAA